MLELQIASYMEIHGRPTNTVIRVERTLAMSPMLPAADLLSRWWRFVAGQIVDDLGLFI